MAQLFIQGGDRNRHILVVVVAGLVTLVDAGGDDVRLPSGRDLLGDSLPGPREPLRLLADEDGVGGDRLAAPRQFAQGRGLQVAEDGQCDGTRDRGCGHHQKMRCQTLGCLGAQTISLLDAEPMLFVHHNQSESGELDGIRQQCVGADHNAGLPGRHLVTRLLLLGGRHRSGQQGNPGRAVLPAELTRQPQRAQHITNGPGVLGGKDFGRCQQRALIAGVHHLQHGKHRHDGLAGSHLALQKAVHRLGGRHLRGDDVEHFALTGSQFKRQSCRHRREQPIGSGRRRRPRCPECAVATLRQRPLHTDRLVEGESLPGALTFGLALGEVNRPQCGILRHQIVLSDKGFRKWLRYRVENVEDLPHAGVDIPALQFCTGRVDREEVSFEHRH